MTEREVPDPIAAPPSRYEAIKYLAAAQDVLLGLWASELPDLATQRAATMCAAHRSVHDAMLLLDDHADVMFPTARIGAQAAH